jgi:hypothetical protein
MPGAMRRQRYTQAAEFACAAIRIGYTAVAAAQYCMNAGVEPLVR